MKKNGFTLVELIAVILLMAMITIIALPNIINQIGSQKGNISELSLKMIRDANNLYMEEHSSKYPMSAGDTYCISLETLVNDGKLKKPLKDIKTDKEIPLNQKLKVVVNSYGEGISTLVGANECTSN